MEKNELEGIDSLTHVAMELEHLSQTMFVIYEGLDTGGMVEDSPHCILVLQTVVEGILNMVQEEQQRLKGMQEDVRNKHAYEKEGIQDE